MTVSGFGAARYAGTAAQACLDEMDGRFGVGPLPLLALHKFDRPAEARARLEEAGQPEAAIRVIIDRMLQTGGPMVEVIVEVPPYWLTAGG